MTKKEIIENIAKEKILEELVNNICGYIDDDLKDLIQDIYIDLFTKPEQMLLSLSENNQIKFFLTKIILNNVFSRTSRYYTKYKKNKNNMIDINNLNCDKY